MQILHTGINRLLQNYIQGMDLTERLSMQIYIHIPTKVSRNCERYFIKTSNYWNQGYVISLLGNLKSNWRSETGEAILINHFPNIGWRIH